MFIKTDNTLTLKGILGDKGSSEGEEAKSAGQVDLFAQMLGSAQEGSDGKAQDLSKLMAGKGFVDGEKIQGQSFQNKAKTTDLDLKDFSKQISHDELGQESKVMVENNEGTESTSFVKEEANKHKIAQILNQKNKSAIQSKGNKTAIVSEENLPTKDLNISIANHRVEKKSELENKKSLKSIFSKNATKTHKMKKNSLSVDLAHQQPGEVEEAAPKSSLNSILGIKSKSGQGTVKEMKTSDLQGSMAKNGTLGSKQVLGQFNANELDLHGLKKVKARGASHYKKEMNALSKNLVKAPVHQEFVQASQKGVDTQGVSEMHHDVFNHAEEVSGLENNILGLEGQRGQGQEGAKLNQDVKVLDLSNVQASDKNSVIKEVSNYIERAYVSGRDSLDLLVKHDDLGEFRVVAQKAGPRDQVNLEISTASREAEMFFSENESDLIRSLQSSGVKLSSVKIVAKPEFSFTMDSSKSGSMDQNFEGNSGSFSGRNEQKSSSNGHNFSGQSDRRRHLWQEAKEFSDRLAA